MFVCIRLGAKTETKENIISYVFAKQAISNGHIYQRGIENNFHESVFLKLFSNNAKYIHLIKRISNTDDGRKEALLSIDIEKVSLCNALCKQGNKNDFINFRGLVSLISELVANKTAAPLPN